LISKYQLSEKVHLQVRRGTQHVPPKCRYLSTKLQRCHLPEGSIMQCCIYKYEF